MKLQDVPQGCETFTAVNDETQAQTLWAVTPLAAYCAAHHTSVPTPSGCMNDVPLDGVALVRVPIEERHARYCLTNRGVETWKLERLVATPALMRTPVIFVKTPESALWMIDGTHRYVVAWLAKLAWLPGYFVPWDVAQAFIIEDAPPVPPAALVGDFTKFGSG